MDRLSLAVEPALLDTVPSRFSSEQLAQARSRAATSGERVLEALGVLCELAPMPFIECLGTTLHYPVLDTDTLFKATPVFDRVTLAQCLKREFILLRHDDWRVRRPLRQRAPGLDRRLPARRAVVPGARR
jgi:general secretion pathway protein E